MGLFAGPTKDLLRLCRLLGYFREAVLGANSLIVSVSCPFWNGIGQIVPFLLLIDGFAMSGRLVE